MFAMGPAFFRTASGGYDTLALSGTFAAATVGTPYSSSLAISGGLAPYSLTGGTGLASGSLPAGLSLSIVGSSLVLSGTPTAASTSLFTASVTSTDGQTSPSPQSVAVSPAVIQTLWSTTNKSVDITLSNGDADCVMTGAGVAGGTVLSDSGHSSGKFYAELRCVGYTSAVGATGCGLHSGTGALTNYIGQDVNGWASFATGSGAPNRNTYHNAVLANSIVNGVNPTGTNVRLAVDLDAGKLWLSYYGSSTWIGGGDPAAGTSPTFTFSPSGTYYLAYTPRVTGAKGRLVAVADWGNSAPTGFGVWSGGVGPSAELTTGPTSSVSASSARISFRTSAASTIAVKYSTAADLSGAITTTGVAVDSATDFTGAVDLSGLAAATEYSYTIMIDGVSQFAAPYPTTKTLPANDASSAFSFAFGSCTMHSTGTDAIFGAVPASASLLLHLGDTIYSEGDGFPAAATLADYRSRHLAAMSGGTVQTSGWKTLRASKPVFTMWDDHDIVSDFCGGTGSALYAPAKQAFHEYQARANPDGPTSGELYYTFQAGDVGFFVLDLRSFRSVNTATDNSSKTIMGATQKAALKSWLFNNNSSLKVKFICASVPAHGYASNTAGDSWGGIDDGTQAPNAANGFRTERNEIWDYIDANAISGVVFLSGDQHWSGSLKTTYAARPRYEFASSPFNNTNLTPPSRAADPTNGPILWKYSAGKNMGVVTVDTSVSPPTVAFQLYGASGSLGPSYLTNLTLTQIDAGL